MKTIVVLNTQPMEQGEVEDLIQYLIIALQWNRADICPHDLQNRATSRNYFLTYIATEDELTLFNHNDIGPLMDDGYRVIQPKDRYDFFRAVMETNY
jgi:hypothetical protein